MATVGLAASVTDRILSLPGWLVLALVFAFPALEASAFVGFVFPGDIGSSWGESRLRVERSPLWAVIAAAVAGAIIGDSIGYLVGRRWGTHLLHGTLGRLPVISTHLDKHVDSARAYVRRRKGSAVFFGRLCLAGISEVHYPTFLVCNVADGALWGTGFAVLGYVAGASYHRVEQIAARAGLVLLGLIVAGLIASRLLRHFFAARVRVRCPCLARIFGPAGDSRTDHDDVDHAERQGVTGGRRRIRAASRLTSGKRYPPCLELFLTSRDGPRAKRRESRAGPGRTPIVKGTGNRKSVNMISAVSPRGKLYFKFLDGNTNAVTFTGFLEDMLHDIPGIIFLIVDGHSAHTAGAN